MKKIKRAAELLWLMGIVLVALGVSICSKADLGVSMIAAPAFILCEALSPLFPWLSVGMTEYLIQGFMLIFLCLVVGRFNWRYLPAFAVAVIYGYVLNLFLMLLSPLAPTTALQSWLLLILGDCITALGVACFFRTYMPLQVYELFVAELSRRFKLDINKTKWCFDLCLLLISLLLAFTLFGDVKDLKLSAIVGGSFHSIGLGTLVTALINSPIIKLMGKLLDKFFGSDTLFLGLEKSLRR